MFYNVPELKPPPLSFPLFIFLSTSHARPHSVVTLLSLILPLFPPLPSRCNASLFWPSLLLLTSVHLPILSDFISHLSYYLSTFSCFIAHLFILTSPSPVLPSPYPFVYFLVYLSLLLAISFSQQRVCLCFGPAVSCLLLLYTHTLHTSAHLCTWP